MFLYKLYLTMPQQQNKRQPDGKLHIGDYFQKAIFKNHLNSLLLLPFAAARES